MQASQGHWNHFAFSIDGRDGMARAGVITTPHGSIETPVFMPVGTRSAIKGLTVDQMQQIGAQILLVNNYHSYLRPGCDVVSSFGGLHRFMSVDLPILTDSGGFQVFSLGDISARSASNTHENSTKKMVRIEEDGVYFRSYLDGSQHFFSAENVMDMQDALGADIIMAFDECAPGNASHGYAQSAVERTHRWAERSKLRWLHNEQIRREKGFSPQALFAIIQGVTYEDLRIESAKYITSLDTPGVAIGGLSVGESKEDMYHILDILSPILPPEKPHYLMGVGTPEDLIEGIARGIDMMDCVLPTRIGRHGEVFTSYGNLKIGNEKYKYSQEKIPMVSGFETSVSQKYSLGYLRHLMNVGEATGGLLLSLHNIEYLLLLAKNARKAILSGTFHEFRKNFWQYFPKD